MSAPVRFLQSLGKLITSAGLYPSNHPARKDAAEAAFAALGELLAESGTAHFSFLEEKVIFGNRPLDGLGPWPWGGRLHEAGVQRLELAPGVEAEELERFATGLALSLGLVAAKRAEAARVETRGEPTERHPHIRYGALDVHAGPEAEEPQEREPVPPLDLREEAEVLRYVHEMAAEREEVPEAETAAIVGSLLVAVRSARELVAPLLQIRETDEYTTTHCMNVSLLAMSLAEFLRLSDADVTAIGEAALLHDIGKTRVPPAILNKPGTLTTQERAVVEHHAVEGSRMLLRSERRNALAAVVAYEHHMHWNGAGGYPQPAVEHRPHRFSRLVQTCDVFDALRTRRPWRPPFTPEATLEFLGSRKGSEFDSEMVESFLAMMRQWEPHLIPRVDGAEEPVEEAPATEEVQPSEEGQAQPSAGDVEDASDLLHRAEKSARGFDADMEGELYGP